MSTTGRTRARRRTFDRKRQRAQVADVHDNASELEAMRRDAPDMQTPDFWARVWRDD